MAKKQPAELPTFDAIEQIMKDKYLIKCINDQVKYFNKQRAEVSRNGFLKLRPSPIDVLIAKNAFNAKGITTEHIEIHYKRSTLPAVVRDFIMFLMTECIEKTFKHYQTLFQKQNNKTLKSKKNGN